MPTEFEEAWERIKSETGLKSLKGLADTLKITQQAVSEMKQKGKFPPGWAYITGKQYNLLTEWIMTGEGPKKKWEKERVLIFYEELECWARETGKSENTQWLRNQIESFFPMFVEWKKRREEGTIDENGEPKSRVA